MVRYNAVSYTHLDVYKRQVFQLPMPLAAPKSLRWYGGKSAAVIVAANFYPNCLKSRKYEVDEVCLSPSYISEQIYEREPESNCTV